VRAEETGALVLEPLEYRRAASPATPTWPPRGAGRLS